MTGGPRYKPRDAHMSVHWRHPEVHRYAHRYINCNTAAVTARHDSCLLDGGSAKNYGSSPSDVRRQCDDALELTVCYLLIYSAFTHIRGRY